MQSFGQTKGKGKSRSSLKFSFISSQTYSVCMNMKGDENTEKSCEGVYGEVEIRDCLHVTEER